MQDHIRDRYKLNLSSMSDNDLSDELRTVLKEITSDFPEDATSRLSCLNLEFTKRDKSSEWLRVYNEHINAIKQL